MMPATRRRSRKTREEAMRRALVLALGTAIAVTSFGFAVQAAPPADKAAAGPSVPPPGWKTPKNAMGQPDLSGYWTNATMTPLTRNRRISDKAILSAAEAKALEKAFAAALAESDAPTDPDASTQKIQDEASKSKLVELRPDFAAAGGDVGGYNSFWIDPG